MTRLYLKHLLAAVLITISLIELLITIVAIQVVILEVSHKLVPALNHSRSDLLILLLVLLFTFLNFLALLSRIPLFRGCFFLGAFIFHRGLQALLRLLIK